MGNTTPLTAALAGASLALAPSASRAQDEPAPPDDVPLITEVLYAVPPGDEGDATADGSRHATGDEFVEIHNSTDRTLHLAGWSITDRNAPDAGQFLFVFPRFALGPGETAVVFNGLEQSIPGPVGTAEASPDGKNEHFHHAWIFTAGNTSSGVGLANSGDWVCLRDPHRNPVSLVRWGKTDEEPPCAPPRLVECPRTSRASVQRTLAAADAPFEAHPTVEGLRFSPGLPPGQPAAPEGGG